MKNSPPPLVSIVIPCYKAERELPEALASIHAQTYPNWEVIVVNDAWEDSTQELVGSFAAAHPNHRVIFEKHSRNQGLGATRNTGMKLSRGEFIAFLDHDDIWEPNHLKLSADVLSNDAVSLSYSRVRAFDSQNKKREWIWGPTDEDLNQFPDSLFTRNYVTPSSVVFKRKVFETLGPMDTDPRVHFCEDHEYWLRAVSKHHSFGILNEITVRYRSNNPEAATSKRAMMLKNDLSVQRKYFFSKVFSISVKRCSIAKNYRILSEVFWKNQHALSLFYLFMSLCWDPFHFPTFRRLVKGLILAPIPK